MYRAQHDVIVGSLCYLMLIVLKKRFARECCTYAYVFIIRNVYSTLLCIKYGKGFDSFSNIINGSRGLSNGVLMFCKLNISLGCHNYCDEKYASLDKD